MNVFSIVNIQQSQTTVMVMLNLSPTLIRLCQATGFHDNLKIVPSTHWQTDNYQMMQCAIQP